MSFLDTLDAYTVARMANTSAARRDAAERLPLDALRDPHRHRDGAHGSEWIARAWGAAVADASHELHNLVTIHDNGGTASSPKKIKKAARELMRLLEAKES